MTCGMHELATVSAMQAAVRVLLAQFEPEAVERKVESSALQIHPAQKKARAWDAFVRLHKGVTQALSDDFDSVFGKAFARAYEAGDRQADCRQETQSDRPPPVAGRAGPRCLVAGCGGPPAPAVVELSIRASTDARTRTRRERRCRSRFASIR